MAFDENEIDDKTRLDITSNTNYKRKLSHKKKEDKKVDEIVKYEQSEEMVQKAL